MSRQFDLESFLPYLLNQAAEHSSAGFQRIYKSKYAMLRTEWRVLFHLGRYGNLSANEICNRGGLHKTKVSRAVAALETKRYVNRIRHEEDRRFEILSLTQTGKRVYQDLSEQAEDYHNEIASNFTKEETDLLIKFLRKLANQ